MADKTGVYEAYKKDGTKYYRSSINYRNKHISLGSFSTENKAAKAYKEASLIIREGKYTIEEYSNKLTLDLDKFVSLINFRDTGIYFKNPIYMRTKYFEYFLSPREILKFDSEDIFFYGKHKIQTKGGYMFVCDYGSQYNILSRFGIKNFAVKDRDYIFANGDDRDFRYENVKVINNFLGVKKKSGKLQDMFEVYIHVKGNYLVGRYDREVSAAIAYNKAVDVLIANGSTKKYVKNYIENINPIEYAKLYNAIKISERIEKIGKIS